MAFLRYFWCFSGLVLIASVLILTGLKHWNLYTLQDIPFEWVIQWAPLSNATAQKEIKMPSLEQEVPFKKATFGMGCFWANDALFGAQRGVLRTRVGYAGGTTPNPVYKDIESGTSESGATSTDPLPGTSDANPRGDHTEVIEIDYDPEIISYRELLKLFWDNHEYGVTTVIKRQYMSLILYHEEEQRHIAELDIIVEAGKRNEKLITEIAPAGPFYPAEDYHQKYRLQKHGWIVEELNLTPEQLQTSTAAAKLNGYVAGVGSREDLERDLKMLGIPEKIASFVRIQYSENEGGNLYC
ncbi:peptide methionine sulfoxide reductase isoform X1 [Euwallacea similis]|uniref:peptide methionine sulfoxide reductase isoform X1 n=2 Tax=Euwallacea similis TaxID=1736056 RepID=UPI00344B4946